MACGERRICCKWNVLSKVWCENGRGGKMSNKYDCSKCLDYEHERNRMCPRDCKNCVLYKLNSPCGIPNRQEKIDIVQKWSDEHPESYETTILEDFKEKYPNYKRNDEGTPSVCANFLYCNRNGSKCPKSSSCKECWNRPLNEVEK